MWATLEQPLNSILYLPKLLLETDLLVGVFKPELTCIIPWIGFLKIPSVRSSYLAVVCINVHLLEQIMLTLVNAL